MKAKYQDILNKGKPVATRIKSKHENCLAWIAIYPYKRDQEGRASYHRIDDTPWYYGVGVFELDKKYDYYNYDVASDYANYYFKKKNCTLEDVEEIASAWLEDLNELGYAVDVKLPF